MSSLELSNCAWSVHVHHAYAQVEKNIKFLKEEKEKEANKNKEAENPGRKRKASQMK